MCFYKNTSINLLQIKLFNLFYAYDFNIFPLYSISLFTVRVDGLFLKCQLPTLDIFTELNEIFLSRLLFVMT